MIYKWQPTVGECGGGGGGGGGGKSSCATTEELGMRVISTAESCNNQSMHQGTLFIME